MNHYTLMFMLAALNYNKKQTLSLPFVVWEVLNLNYSTHLQNPG